MEEPSIQLPLSIILGLVMRFGTVVNTTLWATCIEWWPAGPSSVTCGTCPPWPERKEKTQSSLLTGLSLLLLYKEDWPSFLGMEGWREPRWRTPLRKSSRRITAKWLWAMDLSSRNWTECHPGFPELVLRDGTGWSFFSFFFGEGRKGVRCFVLLFFFLIVNLFYRMVVSTSLCQRRNPQCPSWLLLL